MWHWMFVILKQQICGKHLKHDFCESICNTGFCGNVWESDGLAGIQKDVIWHREAFASFVAFASSNKNAPAAQQKSSIICSPTKMHPQYLQQKCIFSICQKKITSSIRNQIHLQQKPGLKQVWERGKILRCWGSGGGTVRVGWETQLRNILRRYWEDFEMVVGLWEWTAFST